MNTVVHICAAGALGWLSVYCFDTLSNGVLGVAAMGISFVFMFLAIMSIGEDTSVARKIFPKRRRR